MGRVEADRKLSRIRSQPRAFLQGVQQEGGYRMTESTLTAIYCALGFFGAAGAVVIVGSVVKAALRRLMGRIGL